MQIADTYPMIMELEWELDKHNQYILHVKSHGCEARFWMQPRPNYCDRGHWQVHCDYWRDQNGIDTIDRADFFPRLYMSLDTAKSEIAKFIAWRALKRSDGLNELIKHNQRLGVL